jgi:hypothetical protein
MARFSEDVTGFDERSEFWENHPTARDARLIWQIANAARYSNRGSGAPSSAMIGDGILLVSVLLTLIAAPLVIGITWARFAPRRGSGGSADRHYVRHRISTGRQGSPHRPGTRHVCAPAAPVKWQAVFGRASNFINLRSHRDSSQADIAQVAMAA